MLLLWNLGCRSSSSAALAYPAFKGMYLYFIRLPAGIQPVGERFGRVTSTVDLAMVKFR